MSAIDTLYYPAWNPPPGWLKSFLLFSDKVRVIVPDDVKPDFEPANQALLDDAGDLFLIERYTQGDVDIDVHLPTLDAAFADIAASKGPKHGHRFSIVIARDGTSRIPGHVFLHGSKSSESVNELLKKHRLLLPGNFGSMAGDGFMVVEENASALIVGLLADSIGQQKGWQTITHRPLSFALNRYREGMDQDVGAVDALCSLIIQGEVPARIEAYTSSQFLELRQRYAGVRESLRLAAVELAELERLDRIKDPKEIDERLREVASAFGAEVAKVHAQSGWKAIGDTTPFAIGQLSRITGLFPSLTTKLISAGVGISASVWEKVKRPAAPTHRKTAHRLIAGLQREILTAEVFKKLDLYERR
jgi:hypothetical protein